MQGPFGRTRNIWVLDYGVIFLGNNVIVVTGNFIPNILNMKIARDISKPINMQFENLSEVLHTQLIVRVEHQSTIVVSHTIYPFF